MNTGPLFKHGGILAAFAIVTTGLIALTFQGTKDRIAEQVLAKRLAILNEVIPTTMHDNALYTDCIVVQSEQLGGQQSVYRSRLNGEVNGMAIEATAKNGYSGDIDMIVGVDSAMQVKGVRVLQHKETPGLGDKVELSVSDWILSFNEQTYTPSNRALWRVKKDGGQFDQFTGATITPRAVVNTVADTLEYAQKNWDQLATTASNCEGAS
ncbi:electron transport complex subunit RsxG [Alteromonas sediminis]|uniref:Ion-translocating oxidoreductase complex subunit G n=1 Tax=Alteromonas sediminis TaxID=2259342 RepID=A0A3N5Y359_9ALTE|nr:electron transport complex subunit RsxG [Alteromonas sediminis]RPJ68427.1 electron transport complex subunit RsxG [Alteromonas sediminis]